MLGSAKSPVPSYGDGYNLRGFRTDDLMYLIDIDSKCSDIPWGYDQWTKNVNNLTGSVVTFFGTPVGFALFRRMGEYVELVKMAVKPQYRRRKLGILLMSGCFRFAQDMGCHTIFVVVPETYLPDEPAIKFFPACGFTAAKGMVRDCFNFDGRSIDGVKFIQKIEWSRINTGESSDANRT